MSAASTARAGRLAELARAARRASAPDPCCELCAAPLPPEHRHLLEVDGDALRCACTACAVLLDRTETADRRYRAIPERRLRIHGFDLDDAAWARWNVPVGLAFFVPRGPDQPIRALLPGPAGATVAEVDPESWAEAVRAHPLLATLEPHVEALLVRRAGDLREGFVVPLDRAFELVGRVRGRWRGLGGGDAVRAAIEEFFAELRVRSRAVDRTGARLRTG